MLTAEQVADRERLLEEGKVLFAVIGDDLNTLDTRSSLEMDYRREIDHEEICIALALFVRRKGIGKEWWIA